MGDPTKEPNESSSSLEATLDDTLEEHSGCMRLITEVEACLDRRPDEPTRWVAELTAKLTRLEGALARHFKSEEAGPIFRVLPTQHPRLANSLEALEAEHPLMLQDLRQALAAARALDEPELFQVRELNARIQLLVARIRRHEAAENELVVQAYWNEVGVGD